MGSYYRNGILVSADAASVQGQRTLVGATAEQLWGGAAVTRPSPGGIQLGVASSSAQDGVAGTGIRALRLDYLDANGVRQAEVVVMNGIVPVLTVATDIVELLNVTATVVGGAGVADGTIEIRDNLGATVYETIAIGACSTLSAIAKVPAGRRAFVHASSIAASVASQVRLMSDCNPVTGAVVAGASFAWSVDQAGQQGHNTEYLSPLGPFPAGARIWIDAVGAVGRVITGSLAIYLEPAG